MSIAHRLKDYIAQHHLRYDVLTHPHSHNSMETAQLAHVPGRSLAKTVILGDDEGYLMAVLPSTHHVQIGKLGKVMNRPLRLATEYEIGQLFDDCETGAIPPVGEAYGMKVVMDDSLADEPEIYFEAGDHERLIQMSREDFMTMMRSAIHTRFDRHLGHPH